MLCVNGDSENVHGMSVSARAISSSVRGPFPLVDFASDTRLLSWETHEITNTLHSAVARHAFKSNAALCACYHSII